jgi:hypothetical protein
LERALADPPSPQSSSFALALENVSVISPEKPLLSEWLLQKDTIQQ